MLKPILDVTCGCIVYQEQVMQICRELGGYSYGQADLVRRAMSKKKADVMEKERVNFLAGCAKNEIPQPVANDIFDEMSGFAAYAFNKSHAAAYAVVAYQTAYLKRHYTVEYMAALLSSVLDFAPKMIEYIEECTRLGIKVLPPDINKSLMGFTVTEEGIRFGLLAVKNLGRGVIQEIIARRRERPYESFVDFYSRLYECDINKRSLEALIKSGALDSLAPTRRAMIQGMGRIGDLLAERDQWQSAGQTSLFGAESIAADMTLPNAEEYPQQELLAMEREVTGMYMSGHPMSSYETLYAPLRAVKLVRLTDSEANAVYDNASVNVLALITAKRLKLTKNNDNMAFLTVEDMTGSMDVIVFPRVMAEYGSLLTVGSALLLRGRVSLREEETAKLMLESARPPQEAPGGLPAEKKCGTPAGLYLKLPDLQSPQADKARQLLAIFPGETPVFLRTENDGKLLKAPRALWTDPNDVMLLEFRRLLGENSVYLAR